MKFETGKRGLLINILSLIVFTLVWQMLVIFARNDIFNIPFIRLRDIPTPVETWYALLDSMFTRIYGPSFTYGIINHVYASLVRVIEGGIIA
ncbi:MAG: hypothetical protein QSU88_05645, partial [Candidatus Methanoperedens sp.]|nr:hypothetical protein [Candidatus Methanoperedens sp.]